MIWLGFGGRAIFFSRFTVSSYQFRHPEPGAVPVRGSLRVAPPPGALPRPTEPAGCIDIGVFRVELPPGN